MMQRKKKAVDERIVREVNKVYRVAYYLFNIGLCMDLFLKGYSGHIPTGFEAFRYIGFEAIVLIGVNLIVLVMLCRKGLMDDETRYAESDHFPWKHYLMESLVAGAAIGLLACIVRAIGDGQLAGGPLAYVFLFVSMVLCMVIFVLLFAYISYRVAKHRRTRLYGDQEER